VVWATWKEWGEIDPRVLLRRYEFIHLKVEVGGRIKLKVKSK
jgi:hypothetical protein